MLKNLNKSAKANFEDNFKLPTPVKIRIENTHEIDK